MDTINPFLVFLIGVPLLIVIVWIVSLASRARKDVIAEDEADGRDGPIA